MAAAMLGNPYGLEGSALWLIVTTSGAARLDVRSRQLAFALIIGFCALAQTLLLSVTVADYPWPPALALLASSLGAAAGWSMLVGVLAPARMADPHKRSAWSSPARTPPAAFSSSFPPPRSRPPRDSSPCGSAGGRCRSAS